MVHKIDHKLPSESVDQEFKKINLETGEELPMAHKQHSKAGKIIKSLLIIIVVLVLLVGGLGAFAYIKVGTPLKKLYAQGQLAAQTGRELSQAIKTQNIEEGKKKLGEMRSRLTDLKTTYQDILWLKTLPYLGLYVSDGEHGLNAAFAGLDAGDKAIAALEPNADLLGLKGKSTFTSGSADDRLQVAVKTMTALIPQINAMAKDIDTLRKEIDAIDPNRYPEELRGYKVRSQLVSGKATVENAANLFVNAQPLLMNLPKILGEPTEKRYLVLFQNDKELRPTGGFLTAYGQFRLAHGKPILEKSDDIYNLDAALKKKYPAPKEILTYHINVNQLNIRDSNLSPDFKISMDQFMEMYGNVSGAEKLDGIIAMDTHAMVEVLKILGPMYVSGREFSAVNDPRCDCPKAVYELEDYSSKPVNYVRTDRKGIIGTLMQTMMQMALGTSPSKYWGQLFQMALAQINEKHILAYFTDTESQKAVEAFNMAGRIMTGEDTAPVLKYKDGADWDYLHINQANMAGQKSNMFVQAKYTKEVTTNTDGTISTKLTIDYKNPFPGSDCNLEHGNLCLNAPLRNWVRIYVPKGSTLKEAKGTVSPSNGKPQDMITYESFGKTVFEGFNVINPQGIAKLELTYTSPVKVSGAYNVLIQKQPGTEGQDFILKVNGKEKKFPLQTDIEVSM